MQPSSHAEFSIPAGWTVDCGAGVATLVGPEGDLQISFVESPVTGASVQECALAAWQQLDASFDSRVRREAAVPTPDGWDEMHQIVYEVAASEARIELAMVRKLGERWFVNLVRGSKAALSRRGAQLNEAILRWKPVGYRESNLKDTVARAWSDEIGQELAQFLQSSMSILQVPGLSVAVVHSGKVVYQEGFGTRRIGEDAPVTPTTRFLIGSTTKPLTTLLMAMLGRAAGAELVEPGAGSSARVRVGRCELHGPVGIAAHGFGFNRYAASGYRIRLPLFAGQARGTPCGDEVDEADDGIR